MMELMQASGDVTSAPVASEAGMFRCLECGKLFMHERTLKRHAMSHCISGQFACTECGKQYSQSYDLERHARRHTGDRPYKCCMCDRQFLMSHHLTNHMVTHTGLRPYACLVCGKRFAQSFSLKRHMRIHLRLNDDTPDDNMAASLDPNGGLSTNFGITKTERIALLRSLSCVQCGKVFCSQQTLSRHHCHQPTDDTDNKVAVLNICNQVIFDPQVLQPHHHHQQQQQHLQQNTSSFYVKRGGTTRKLHRCRSCGVEFGSVRLLNEHTAVAHPEHIVKPYACSNCSKRFAHPYSLKRHRVEHGDGEAISCPVCGKRFAQQYELNRHMKSHRSAEQAICAVCSRQFPKPPILGDEMQGSQTCDSCLRVGFAQTFKTEPDAVETNCE